MARHHAVASQGRRDRQVEAGLADVVAGIGQQRGAAGLELRGAGAGADGDAVAAAFADRLHHELGQVVERIGQRVGLPADAGVDVRQNRVLPQIVADDPRHVGVDRLVVGDAGADRVGQRDMAGAIGPHQPRHAERAVGAERFGVEEVVVDAAVDDVDRPRPGGGQHRHPVIGANHQVAALDQRHAIIKPKPSTTATTMLWQINERKYFDIL